MINPIIFVPGIKGSILRDAYETPPGEVWRGTKGQYERVQLHPSDMRYEYKEPARVMASQIYDRYFEKWNGIGDIYLEMIDDLRTNLRVPVYPFFYDWRKDLNGLRSQFRDFVEEVIARTALIPEYKNDKYTKDTGKVILIGHSMGGLLIARYMGETNIKVEGNIKAEDRVDKIVTIATPFQGTPDVIKELCINKNSDAREAARLCPSVYYLLPRYKESVVYIEEEAVSDEVASDNALFNVDNWQDSIIDSFIPDGDKEPGKANLGRVLGKAEDYLQEIDKLNETIGKEWLNKNWLCIVGDKQETMQKVVIKTDAKGKPLHFEFNLNPALREYQKKYYSTDGDEVVPLSGAIPRFFDQKDLGKIVAYKYDDFEWCDDWPAAKFSSLHALLPAMNVLIRLVKEYIKGSWQPGKGTSGKYDNLWTHKLP